mmetsp:Transcript_8962/g.21316  ORF Transcript_8962/g.21316 Transcript_8962/m.21316 type:complete len:1059 (-) Transcript_8962:2662-5838(-)
MSSMVFIIWIFLLVTISSTIAERDLAKVSPRIIGGFDAPQGRYPYIVELVNPDGSPRCGGILVATDVVLTAAHCSGGLGFAYIGRWNRDNPNEGYDNFTMKEIEYIHPQFVEDLATSFDFMLLKLTQQSSKAYIKLNENPDIPAGQRVDEVTALGFGTISTDLEEYPSTLQQVELTYINNNECEKSKDPNYADNYQGLISSDMLCAGDFGQDTCRGDSGGPLIVDGGSPDKDIVVGIVSWGFGCALPAFPGIYSRVSHEVQWIKQTICYVSDSPPTEYDCSLYTPPVDGENTVPVTVTLNLDDFPEETGWSIRNKADGTVYGQAKSGDYTTKRDTVIETVFLPAGSTCIFEITDAFGDGMCCNNLPGTYVIMMGRAATGTVIASGGDKFGASQQHELIIPTDYNGDSNGPVIGEGQIAMMLVLQLDSNPSDNGWRVDQLGGVESNEVVRVPPGAYRTPRAKIVRTIALDEGELYAFRVSDLGNDGIQDGYVQIFLGTTDIEDESRKIFDNTGDFQGSLDFSFISSFDTDPTSPPRLDSEFFLTLELRLDLYPEEISFQVRAKSDETALSRQNRDDSVIFFRPPRFYTDKARQTVTEIIPLPTISSGASRDFTFIISDEHGDGLCCNWSGSNGELPGYTMYERGPGLDKVLFGSNMEGVGKEVHEFTIEGPPLSGDKTLSPVESLPTVKIKITIALDGYPTETGFAINEISGKRVVDRPPGSFSSPSSLMEEIITLEIGVYEFFIFDSFENGLEREDSFYRIDIVDGQDRAPIVKGSGRFSTQESKVFVLEGETADAPIDIEFTLDNHPSDFGFFLKRLDLVAPEAFVAEVPPGSYSGRNQKVTESLKIRKGGLYIIVFEDSGRDGIGGNILVNVGSKLDGKTYSIDFANQPSWQLKFLAGDRPATASGGKRLELKVKFDQFPQELEWILVADVNADLINQGRALQEQQVVAFSNLPYSQDLENKNHVETIPLPPHIGSRTFTMIITDSEGDGICCEFDSGGPVELFDNGRLLFTDPFEGVSRAYHSFVVTDNESVSPAASISAHQSLLLSIALILMTR